MVFATWRGASRLPIVITEVQPGGVDTAMLKPDRPISETARRLFVASPATAARQIVRAIHRQAKHAYVTRRYAVVAVHPPAIAPSGVSPVYRVGGGEAGALPPRRCRCLRFATIKT
jgi:hypothetical protein